METKINSSELLDLIPSINPQKNYWLVRTSSGSNYDDFINGGYIAIPKIKFVFIIVLSVLLRTLLILRFHKQDRSLH